MPAFLRLLDKPVRAPGINNNLLEEFQRYQEPLVRERVSISLILAWVLVPFFGWVDYVLYPEHFVRFMTYRIVASSCCLTLYAINRKWNLGSSSLMLALACFYIVGATLIKMVLETGGYATPYYAGLTLLFLTFCTVLVVRVRFLIMHSAILYAIYLACVVFSSHPEKIDLFLSNNMFIISTLVVTLLASNVDYQLRLKEFLAQTELKKLQTQLETYSKDLEHTVAESEEKYRMLVDNANDAIFVVQDDSIRFPNPKTLELSGYSAGELDRMPFIDLIVPDDRDTLLEKYRKLAQAKSAIDIYSFRIVNKAGQTLWVDMNFVPIEWRRKPAFLVFLRDITERKKMELELVRSQKMEAMGTLAGGIAHDFNNILAAIMGYAEIAFLQLPEGSPVQQSLSNVLKASHRARDLVSQILTFSRQSEQEWKPIQIGVIVKETLKLLRALLPATVEIRQEIADESAMIFGDPTQIHQVLMNLCTNAAQAMYKQDDLLEVSVTKVDVDPDATPVDPTIKPGPYVCLTVRDTGCGMEAEVMERIFDPFFTTKGPGQGTGLGLSVVHGIVKGHGGTITVSSEPGKGSVFKVFFPRVKKKAVPVSKMSRELPPGSEHILFVDDEHALVQMAKEAFQNLGYKVTAKASSLEALEVFRAHPERFDLVITDQTMPKMTGLNLAQEVLQIRTNIPIILCTGYSEQTDQERAKAAGIREFVMKPYMISNLARIVRRVLDNKP